jgi:hypothetical protein
MKITDDKLINLLNQIQNFKSVEAFDNGYKTIKSIAIDEGDTESLINKYILEGNIINMKNKWVNKNG